MIYIDRRFRCNQGKAEKAATGEFIREHQSKLQGDLVLYGTPTAISLCNKNYLLNDSCVVIARILYAYDNQMQIIIGNKKDKFKAQEKVHDFKSFGFQKVKTLPITPSAFGKFLSRIKEITTIVFMMSGQYKAYYPVWQQYNKNITNVLIMVRHNNSFFTWDYWDCRQKPLFDKEKGL